MSGPTWTSLCGLLSEGRAVPWHPALEPNAFLMLPMLAAVAEDAVAVYSSATDSTWELA